MKTFEQKLSKLVKKHYDYAGREQMITDLSWALMFVTGNVDVLPATNVDVVDPLNTFDECPI